LTLARAQRAAAARGGRTGRFAARSRRGGASAAVQGRWSLTEPLLGGTTDPGTRRRAIAELMLERYGVLTREQVLAEGIAGGFSAIYSELTQLETLGIARRGYFVEGLGGAQFALPGAVERLRAPAGIDPTAVVLSAVDPAQPYGGVLAWPNRGSGGPDRGSAVQSRGSGGSAGGGSGRGPARTAGAFVVLVGGEPALYLERGGKGMQTLVPLGDDRLRIALDAIVAEVGRGRIKRVALEKVDGEPVMGSPLAPLLSAAGFEQGPRRLTLSA
jgi:ATP-dependent Lhr-like helicase